MNVLSTRPCAGNIKDTDSLNPPNGCKTKSVKFVFNSTILQFSVWSRLRLVRYPGFQTQIHNGVSSGLERQDLSCTHLAHHELESALMTIITTNILVFHVLYKGCVHAYLPCTSTMHIYLPHAEICAGTIKSWSRIQ